MTPLSLRGRGLGFWAWVFFGAQIVGVIAWAIVVDRSAKAPVASGEITGPDRVRFGKTEAQRRQMYQELVRDEPARRARAERQSDTAIWDRNRDSYFHQEERGEIPAVCARLGIPPWQGYLIMDEGFHEHWPPPPGVEVRADDAPIVRLTRPLAQRHLIAAGPPLAPPSPPKPPVAPVSPPAPSPPIAPFKPARPPTR